MEQMNPKEIFDLYERTGQMVIKQKPVNMNKINLNQSGVVFLDLKVDAIKKLEVRKEVKRRDGIIYERKFNVIPEKPVFNITVLFRIDGKAEVGSEYTDGRIIYHCLNVSDKSGSWKSFFLSHNTIAGKFRLPVELTLISRPYADSK